MTDLFIEKTYSLPGFDYKKNGQCRIFGNSRPENVEEIGGIYEIGMKFLEKLTSMGILIDFTFEFDYFNTSTQKYIYNILFLLESQPVKGSVTWIYFTIDEDMEEMGTQYKDMFKKLKIKLKRKKL
jgi:hypothetical protein